VNLPNAAQGYGAVDLSRVLWLDPTAATAATNSSGLLQGGSSSLSSSSPRKLRVTDGENVTDGQIISYCVAVTAAAELRATLVWTDPPALPQAARVLINDLDLRVISPDLTEYLGNSNVLRACVRRETDEASKCATKDSWDAFLVRDEVNIKKNVESVLTCADGS